MGKFLIFLLGAMVGGAATWYANKRMHELDIQVVDSSTGQILGPLEEVLKDPRTRRMLQPED